MSDNIFRAVNSTLIYIERGGEYLMLHRTKKENDLNRDKWIGVGGKFEADESPEECMLREAKEETGLTIRNPILCGIEEFRTQEEDRYLMLYYKTDKFSGKLKSSEEGEVFWIDKKDLDKYSLSLDLKRIYKIMNRDDLSELIYYEKDGKWRSKIV